MSFTSFTKDQQIRCLEREIFLREEVYPKRVASGKMKQETADREIACLQSIIELLKHV